MIFCCIVNFSTTELDGTLSSCKIRLKAHSHYVRICACP